ncbi:unnamed protein product [Brachionus calyciflorus]|uniref:Uncharacterized protein n=1 Tax=Brachionus calyciflorus TaxID=104777 RepID=A0A813Z4G6_9BILA|nr:unnamed protein product [Brachionus calyciflorus]
MKSLVVFSILILIEFIFGQNSSTNETEIEYKENRPTNLINPLKFLGKCISDHECKSYEYCDHIGINPFGSCKEGRELNQKCVFDRHCKTKYCHLLKCVKRKPIRDGPCSDHTECIQEQYCSSL